MVTTGPTEFRQARQLLRLTQDQLADQLKTTRRSIIRYEDGSRRIPGMAEVALQHLPTTHISMAGIVAADAPIEPIPQTERVDVPKSMLGRGDTFGLRVKGTSMRDDGILPGDVVVVQKQSTARNGQTVIALVNGEIERVFMTSYFVRGQMPFLGGIQPRWLRFLGEATLTSGGFSRNRVCLSGVDAALQQ